MTKEEVLEDDPGKTILNLVDTIKELKSDFKKGIEAAETVYQKIMENKEHIKQKILENKNLSQAEKTEEIQNLDQYLASEPQMIDEGKKLYENLPIFKNINSEEK